MTGIPWTWADTIQVLIGSGHRRADVWTYTLAEVRAYSEAIDRERRRRDITLAMLLRYAPNLETDDFAEFVRN